MKITFIAFMLLGTTTIAICSEKSARSTEIARLQERLNDYKSYADTSMQKVALAPKGSQAEAV